MEESERKTAALIYDFDGTLSPSNMQEYGLIQAFGSEPEGFWKKCEELSVSSDASEILCYMKQMIDEARRSGVRLTREKFREFGSGVKLFQGVAQWFSLINAYGASKDLNIVHYINSSGLTEMIEGTSISGEFAKVYACKFLYDSEGVAQWPGVALDYTGKTQFIFKINKGIHEIYDHRRINRYIPEEERPVPFSRMIYIGDGATDIPCMRLVRQYGGHSIAVYDPEGDSREVSERLLEENRVNFVCPADYRSGSRIHQVVMRIIDKIKADLDLQRM